VAARGIRVQHGILSALDYLIGEKLLTYADTAVTNPEFARELPRFVAEVRDIFSGEEIRHYLDHLERMAVIEDEQATDEDNSDFLKDSAEQLAAKRARFAQLRELLTSTVLGTGWKFCGPLPEAAVPFDTSSTSCLGQHLCVIENGLLARGELSVSSLRLEPRRA
jgi:hypothetical protein